LTRPKGQRGGDVGSAGVEFWDWICQTYFHPEVEVRRSDGRDTTSFDNAQIIFRFDRAPEVRFGTEVLGRQIVEGRLELAGLADEGGVAAVQNDSTFELPDQDSAAGHVTAINRASGLDLVICGAAGEQPIKTELDGADEFIDSAERALDGPPGPFANATYPAAEMLARAELLRLPDPARTSAKTHDTVRARYNHWARFGNTEARFAELLNVLGDLQDKAKYKRSQFSLTSSKAAEHLQTLHDMRRHVERRPRRTVALTAGEFVRLPPD
jgi:hypothetical protein